MAGVSGYVVVLRDSQNIRMKRWKYILVLLGLVGSLILIGLFQLPDGKLHIIACDVGQGDATLMIYKNYQILVDGGPDEKVVSCLGKYLPFWDRELELVILTHPDKDHFAGLTEVFRRYKVGNFLANAVTISKPEYGVLEKEVGSHPVGMLYPDIGQTIRVGLIYLDILNPDGDVSGKEMAGDGKVEVTDAETNGYSIVSLVSFGKFKAILTGDMTPAVSDKLAGDLAGEAVNYIKISHHGSNNGMTENLLKVLMPEIAVISVGKNNIYGHPAPEILEMLKKYNLKILRTDETGDIEIVTDGEKYWMGEGNM